MGWLSLRNAAPAQDMAMRALAFAKSDLVNTALDAAHNREEWRLTTLPNILEALEAMHKDSEHWVSVGSTRNALREFLVERAGCLDPIPLIDPDPLDSGRAMRGGPVRRLRDLVPSFFLTLDPIPSLM